MCFIGSQVLTNCTKQIDTFNCVSTIESVWFKIVNATEARMYVTSCDPIFYKKYGDVTYDFCLTITFSKHKCDNNGKDPFVYLYEQIGVSNPMSLTISDVLNISMIYRGWSSTSWKTSNTRWWMYLGIWDSRIMVNRYSIGIRYIHSCYCCSCILCCWGSSVHCCGMDWCSETPC